MIRPFLYRAFVVVTYLPLAVLYRAGLLGSKTDDTIERFRSWASKSRPPGRLPVGKISFLIVTGVVTIACLTAGILTVLTGGANPVPAGNDLTASASAIKPHPLYSSAPVNFTSATPIKQVLNPVAFVSKTPKTLISTPSPTPHVAKSSVKPSQRPTSYSPSPSQTFSSPTPVPTPTRTQPSPSPTVTTPSPAVTTPSPTPSMSGNSGELKPCFQVSRLKRLLPYQLFSLLSGGTVAYASAATTVAPPSNLYGCVTGPDRVLEHVYTVQSNFAAYLNTNGGVCPSGFAVTVNSAQSAPTPSPSPTATTPTPTPTPTSGTPKYELTTLDRSQTPNMSDANVIGGTNDSGPAVRQEVWNPDPALRKQDTKVWSPGNWTTTINAAIDNTAVNSYPDVSDTVTNVQGNPNPVSGYKSLVSTYAENMNVNNGTDAEAAYDIWLNNYNNELMIWVDNHGQTPAGNDTGKMITVGGNTYHVWNDGTSHDTVSLVLDHNAQSGSTDILGIVKALQAMSYYSATAGFDQINFGFETPSTGGVDETFAVTGYTLKYS